MNKIARYALAGGVALFSEGVSAALDTEICVKLEEPASDKRYTGISNLRGYALGPDGIDRVEIWIDGEYAFDVPQGGVRGDGAGIAASCPSGLDPDLSGFSAAFNYNDDFLPPGSYRFTARAVAPNGDFNEASSEFVNMRFGDDNFIAPNESVSVDGADLIGNGRSVTISGLQVKDQPYDVTLTWNPQTQGFSIAYIAPEGEGEIDLRGTFDYRRSSLLCPGAVERGTLSASYSGTSYILQVSTPSALTAGCALTGPKEYEPCAVSGVADPVLSAAEMALLPGSCVDSVYDLFFGNALITTPDSFLGNGSYLGVPGSIEAARR